MKKSRQERCRIKCPEGMGESWLLLQWQAEEGKEEVLNGASCDNQFLKDYGGGDCGWTCWDELFPQKDG